MRTIVLRPADPSEPFCKAQIEWDESELPFVVTFAGQAFVKRPHTTHLGRSLYVEQKCAVVLLTEPIEEVPAT